MDGSWVRAKIGPALEGWQFYDYDGFERMANLTGAKVALRLESSIRFLSNTERTCSYVSTTPACMQTQQSHDNSQLVLVHMQP